jgi:hypothetical protein
MRFTPIDASVSTMMSEIRAVAMSVSSLLKVSINADDLLILAVQNGCSNRGLHRPGGVGVAGNSCKQRVGG